MADIKHGKCKECKTNTDLVFIKWENGYYCESCNKAAASVIWHGGEPEWYKNTFVDDEY